MTASFQFGGNVNTKVKYNSVKKFDSLLKENWREGEKYFIFLTDFITSKFELDLLIKDIESSKIKSYCIVSSTSILRPTESDAVKIDDSTDTLLSLESNWRDLLEFNGKRVDAIVAFGSAIRMLNKSGDVNWYDFVADTFFDPRYWCGSEFVNGPDCWVYTSPGLDILYPLKCKSNPVNWTTRFFREQLRRIQKDDLSSKSLDMRDYKIISPQTKEETSAILKTLYNSNLLSLDIETDGFHFMRNKIGYLQLSNDGEIAYFFEWQNIDKRILNQVLKTAKRITGANLKFDFKFLWNNGVSKDVYYTDDITLLSHAMHSERPKGLKPASIFWCGKFTGYDLDLDKIKKKLNVDNYLQIPKSDMVKYAAIDAIVAWRIQKALDKKVKWFDRTFPNEKVPEWTIENWYKTVMIPNTLMAMENEFEGVYFDIDQFDISEKAINNKILELKKELSSLWGVPETFKFESAVELGRLFEKMGWPKIDTSKAGDFKTSDEVLVEYESLDKPGIKELKKLRSYNVALGTFVTAYRDAMVKHDDGTYRIHPNCNCFGTSSYRHSMKTPNFQQIPNSGEIAPYIKELFSTPGKRVKYKISDENNVYEGYSNDIIKTQRGELKFSEVVETDIILA